MGPNVRALLAGGKGKVPFTRAGPSSNGRTADFGSVNGGSNPPGPILPNELASMAIHHRHLPGARDVMSSQQAPTKLRTDFGDQALAVIMR